MLNAKNQRAGLIVVLLGLFVVIMPAVVFSAASEQEYRKRFQELNADDVTGHLKLAFWLKNEESWDLLKQQCTYLLGLEPDHRQAQLLLKLAKSHLKENEPVASAPPAPTTKPVVDRSRLPKPLDPVQINLLKQKELQMQMREDVRVKFNNDVLNRFWGEYSFAMGQANQPVDRSAFNKMTAAQKAQLIITAIEEWGASPTLAADVEIVTDPLVFDTYKRRVWPIIRNGCATSECHGGDQAVAIRLHNEPRMDDVMHYTNFLILDEYVTSFHGQDKKMLNRDFPAESLLVMFGSPQNDMRTSFHPGDVRPIFNPKDRSDYNLILQWLDALEDPHPEYGFKLEYPKN